MARWSRAHPRVVGIVARASTLVHRLKIVCDAAGLERPKGGGFHMFRRRFVSLRPDASVSALKELGGWTQASTIIDIYQRPSAAALRDAVELPRARKAKTSP